MRRKIFAVLMGMSLLIIGGLLYAPAIFAMAADISTADVGIFAVAGDLDIPGPGVIDPDLLDDPIPGSWSKLVRNDSGLSISTHTSGLPPGAYTFWWIIDEDGNGFSPTNPRSIGINAGGKVVGSNGIGNFGAHLPVGAIPPQDWVTILRNGDGTFDTPRTANVMVVLRYHGPKFKGLVDEQISTFLGGCINVGGTGISPSGDFVCYDPQRTIHMP